MQKSPKLTTFNYFYFLNGPILASFLFIFIFSTLHNSINWWKHRWCAWDSNPGWQDGRRSPWRLMFLVSAVKTSFLNLIYHRAWYFFKWANPASFVYFRPFPITISIIQIEKSFDGVLGIWTRGRRRYHGAMSAAPHEIF